MLVVYPFRGIIYNKEKVSNLSRVVAPPYDVISSSEQEFYYRLHPYNIIRVILGKDERGDGPGENKYTRAAKFFRTWLSQGILKKEKESSIYTYYQKYQVNGKKVEREGFISLLKLEELSSGLVLPHEHVFPEPQEDRLNLLRACRANFSAIFTLFSDPERKIDALYKEAEPLFEFETSEGIKHRLSSIHDREIIDRISSFMREKKVFIADGHHRYLTALRYKDDVKNKPNPPAGADYVMVYFLNMDSPGVTILPVHRLIGKLTTSRVQKLTKEVKRLFHKKSFKKFRKDEKDEAVAKRLLSEIEGEKECVLGMYTKREGCVLLFPKNSEFFLGKIKSAALDELIKNLLGKNSLKKGEEIDFTTDVAHAVREVQRGKFQIAFFLTPVAVDEIKKVALSGEKMPPKSSYFYPKLLSGLVMRDLEDAV